MDNKEDLKRRADTDPVSAPSEIRHSDGRIEHPAVKRELADLRLNGVAVTLIGVALTLTAVGTGARLLFNTQIRHDAARWASKGPHQAGDELPLQPRLEPFEPHFPSAKSFAADIGELEAQLHRYSPSEDSAVAHVPIEVAIQHVAKTLQPKSGGSSELSNAQRPVVSGAANSGRVFREFPP